MSLDNQTYWNWSHHHYDGPSLQTRLAFASAWIFIAVAGVIGETAQPYLIWPSAVRSFVFFQEILWWSSSLFDFKRWTTWRIVSLWTVSREKFFLLALERSDVFSLVISGHHGYRLFGLLHAAPGRSVHLGALVRTLFPHRCEHLPPRFPLRSFDQIFCKLLNFISFVSVLVTVLTLVAMTIDRYIYVVRPFENLRWRKPRTVFLLSLIIWLSEWKITSFLSKNSTRFLLNSLVYFGLAFSLPVRRRRTRRWNATMRFTQRRSSAEILSSLHGDFVLFYSVDDHRHFLHETVVFRLRQRTKFASEECESNEFNRSELWNSSCDSSETFGEEVVEEATRSDTNGGDCHLSFLIMLVADHPLHRVGECFHRSNGRTLLLQSDRQLVCLSQFSDQSDSLCPVKS